MKKIHLILAVLALLILTSCNVSSPAQAPTPLNHIPSLEVPSLEKLAGRYEDGSSITEKVYISEKLLAEAQRMIGDALAEGCDISSEEIITLLLPLEGQTHHIPFTITAASETEGTLQYDAGDISTKPMSFTYSPDNGTMAFDMIKDGWRVTGSLFASYIEENKVEVSGILRMTAFIWPDEKDFYIDTRITGTKSLDGQ